MAVAAEAMSMKTRNYELSDQVYVAMAITVITIALPALNDLWKSISRITCCSVNTCSLFSYLLLGYVLHGRLRRAVVQRGKFSLFFPLE